MSTDAPMKIKSLAPWFGGKRKLAPLICEQLGKHTQYFEPFCGSMAVLLAKQPSQNETANDLHGGLNNLALVVQDTEAAAVLYDRLQRVVMADALLKEAQFILAGADELTVESWAERIELAFWYFVASWCGRNGTSGTARNDYQLCVRWTNSGGSPAKRFQNTVESLPAWHRRLRNVVILKKDGLEILPRFEDATGTAIYCDPPYLSETRTGINDKNRGNYVHDWVGKESAAMHARLAEILRRFRRARIVVSYYDAPEVRALYPGWSVLECYRQKQLHVQNGRGAGKQVAPEVLLINGPIVGGGRLF